MLIATLIFAACTSLAQNAAQQRAADQAAQQATSDAFEAQRRQGQEQWLAGRRQLLASDYFLSERLYWTTMLAVESLPEAERIGAKDEAEAMVVALSSTRKALASAWTPSAPTSAGQALDEAARSAGLLEGAAAAAPALSLKNRALWIAKSAAEIRKGLPNAAGDWASLLDQSRCFTLKGPSSIFYAPGALAAIGLERVSRGDETLTLSGFAMEGTTLKARAELKRGKTVVSSSDASFPLDRPVSFGRITLVEKTAGPDVCHLTRASGEALFDLPAD